MLRKRTKIPIRVYEQQSMVDRVLRILVGIVVVILILIPITLWSILLSIGCRALRVIASASYLGIMDCRLYYDEDNIVMMMLMFYLIPCVIDSHSNVPSFKNDGLGIKKHGRIASYSLSVKMNSTTGAIKKQIQAMNSFML